LGRQVKKIDYIFVKNLKCRAQIHTRVSLAIRLLVVRVKLKLSALKPNILKPVMAAMWMAYSDEEEASWMN
jgi:hypothetical protein